jgi:hypothetical protein
VKRAWIAAVGIAAVFVSATCVFDCCALPFHRVLHRYLACGHMSGGAHQKVVPAKAPLKRFVLAKAETLIPVQPPSFVLPRPMRMRDRIAHGALRCDDDVGLQLLHSLMLV